MSEFIKELHLTTEFCQDGDIDSFTKHIPIQWIEEADIQTGRASERKRRFPADQAA